MNNHPRPDHPHEDDLDLGQALTDQVRDMNDAPLAIDDIRHRAGTVRRRRAMIAGAGIAAAAAIAVPLALVASNNLGDQASPPVAAQSPSASASPSPGESTAATGPMDLDVSDLSTGDAPALFWAEGTTIHSPDGSTVEVSGIDSISDLAPMGDGWIVATSDAEANLWVVSVAPDGTADVADRTPLDGGLATSPGGSVVAWASPTGDVTVVQSRGDETLSMPKISAQGPYDAVAVSSEDCQEGRTTPAGCTVYVNTKGRDQVAWVSASHGFSDRYDSETRATTGVGVDVVAGITKVTDDGTCSKVTRAGKTLWTTCDFRVWGFSSSGELAVAQDDYGDGFGPTDLAVLDATDGSPLFHRQAGQSAFTTVFDPVWEDDSHVLTVTFLDGRWAVVRVAVDGSMEYAVPPVKGQDLDRPFVLQTR